MEVPGTFREEYMVWVAGVQYVRRVCQRQSLADDLGPNNEGLEKLARKPGLDPVDDESKSGFSSRVHVFHQGERES